MDLVSVTSYRRAGRRSDLSLTEGEVLVSGGTWLFSERQPGTTGLVDLTSLGWTPWERADGVLRVAATCTIEQLLAVPAHELGLAAPLVRRCADALLMSFKVQHLATVGGNVCLALPAGAMISLCVALGAEAVVWTADGHERRQPVSELVTGVRSTTLTSGEVLRAVEIPLASLTERIAFRRMSLAPLGRSSVLVAARRTPLGVEVSLTAATTRPVVLRLPADANPATVEAAVAGIDCWYADAHGPADWRAAMALRLALECLEEVAR